MPILEKVEDSKERFEDKFIKTDSCWIWQACLRGSTGYGAFKFGNKTYDSHRFSYFLYKGEISDGLLVCHTCDERKCVNPDHLFLGTPKDNHSDAVEKGRIVPIPQKHPSISAYQSRGCRCEDCRRIKSDYKKDYRRRKQQQ